MSPLLTSTSQQVYEGNYRRLDKLKLMLKSRSHQLFVIYHINHKIGILYYIKITIYYYF